MTLGMWLVLGADTRHLSTSWLIPAGVHRNLLFLVYLAEDSIIRWSC